MVRNRKVQRTAGRIDYHVAVIIARRVSLFLLEQKVAMRIVSRAAEKSPKREKQVQHTTFPCRFLKSALQIMHAFMHAVHERDRKISSFHLVCLRLLKVELTKYAIQL